jgi:DNA-binding NtrC family response regulator
MASRIVIVDDDEGFAGGVARTLRRSGHDVQCFPSAGAVAAASELAADVLVVDQQLPDSDGLTLVDRLRQRLPGAVFLVATAFPDVDLAVEAMRRGAFDYVAKGADVRECLIRIERAAEVALLRRTVAEAGTAGETGESSPVLLGASEAMRRLRARLEALAASADTTTLLMGETGTGKGLVAQHIHAQSARSFEPLVAVDCTTIPATLVESELFGHERGAFSGATTTKIGRVESAGRGTLFLDEIGELDLPIQAKLLRLLEEREFTRVGSNTKRHLEARIVTATNRDLARAVAEGRFRADLRYRLEVYVVEVPPLRERGEDILLLAAHFAALRARKLGRPVPVLSPEAASALLRYPFPGNVRELRNMVEQAVLLAPGEILSIGAFPVLDRHVASTVGPVPWLGGTTPAGPPPPGRAVAPATAARAEALVAEPAPPVTDGRASSAQPVLPEFSPREPAPRGASERAAPPPPPASPAPTLAEIRARHAARERDALVAALEAAGGNVTRAARALGISRFRALRLLDKHGLR